MIRVEDDRDPVRRSNAFNVVGAGNSTSDGSLLFRVVDALPGEELGTTLRYL